MSKSIDLIKDSDSSMKVTYYPDSRRLKFEGWYDGGCNLGHAFIKLDDFRDKLGIEIGFGDL